MATLSLNNAKHPAPKWFRKTKKAIQILTVAANVMVAQWGFQDQLLTTKLQLWCTIGIAAVLDAFETLLKDDGEDEQKQI
ncbi:hypothetical protein FAM09_24760 [Niastella caeni]|uniref:Uncharacterized protein n=1 Tax=Niastella caeni TaxID=2569763 RepID=A0A4S8HGX9_9BACT|nr:hypothetical protein [Niastella caeni]THU34233.1 hypothetical protein FAM09_24760 [Niastella caeni]